MRRCLLDMDGTIVKFVEGACAHHQVPVPSPYPEGEPSLEDVLGMSKLDFSRGMFWLFWANLKPTDEFQEMMGLLEKSFGRENICILTSPISSKPIASFEGKLEWIGKYLPDFYEDRRYLVGKVKQFCASDNSWLIDDDTENCRKFYEWGGHPIQVPTRWNRLSNLADCVIPYLKRELPGI